MFYKHQPAYGVIGDLSAQYCFAETVKVLLKDLFGKGVKDLGVSTGPFFAYDSDASPLSLSLSGKVIELSAKEQGAIATLRLAKVRGLKQIENDISVAAADMFSPDFYNLYFVKTDWRYAPIYQELNEAQQAYNK